jgi:hypothetical protein
MSKVPTQKGPIMVPQKTMKSMTHAEKSAERAEQGKMLKAGSTLSYGKKK